MIGVVSVWLGLLCTPYSAAYLAYLAYLPLVSFLAIPTRYIGRTGVRETLSVEPPQLIFFSAIVYSVCLLLVGGYDKSSFLRVQNRLVKGQPHRPRHTFSRQLHISKHSATRLFLRPAQYLLGQCCPSTFGRELDGLFG